MRKVHWVIIHCSDSNLSAHDSIEVINQWHIQRGFKKVGYHYFVRSDGTIEKGRDENEVGAHVKGHNSNSLGICLHGKNEFTIAQFKALEILLIDICSRHDLEKKDILSHNDLDGSKSCPNFDLHGLLASWEWH